LVAERYGISEQTVWKWRKRDGVHDRSHTPHRLQTTLTPAQEAVAVALRTTLLLPLDDLLAVVREFLNPNVSRSGLDRCLRRHGVGNLRDLKPKAPRPAHKPFKAYEPGYLHIDVKYLPQMADEERRRYLFVAIDRATRWVFVRIYPAKTAANARRFLRDLDRAAPMKITRVLTDNGKEFTDRLFGLRKRAATGNHEFDRLCADLGIEHRLAPPMRPQTNGMVERFNGRIEDVLQSHRFRSGEDLEQTILRYVRLYGSGTPARSEAALTGQYYGFPFIANGLCFVDPGARGSTDVDVHRGAISAAFRVFSAGWRHSRRATPDRGGSGCCGC
jgi:transposase InsO family protein